MEQVFGPLRFAPVDLSRHEEICRRFRADSFAVSFSDASRFHEEDGLGGDRYVEWLRGKQERDPASVVHVWQGDEIIGQMELGRLRGLEGVGYVNLYYLAPAHRGRGLAKHLDEYAASYLRGLGFTKAQLSVSPSNARAIAYYQKMGWRDLGPRADEPSVHSMEKDL